MNSAYQKWQTHSRKNVDGVVVATDITQEWLLPWWWENFRKYNACPVAFVNFCMSEEKKAWCREHGELIPLLVVDDFVAEREEIATELVSDWEKSFSKKFWPSRNAWFKKSLACLQSPFQRTIWCDL